VHKPSDSGFQLALPQLWLLREREMDLTGSPETSSDFYSTKRR
jgi:hypothetical protein